MFRELLSHKVVLAGILFCFLMVSGSLLYSCHVNRGIQEEDDRIQRLVQQYSAKNADTQTTPQTEPSDISTLEQPDALATDDIHETVSTVAAETEAEQLAETDFVDVDEELLMEETHETATDHASSGISPYGFGPYPKVPPDFPEQDIWDDISTRSMSPNHELIARVQIKLWNQGIHALGAVFNGKYRLIYPIIDNVVYIKWADSVGADGKPYVQRWLTSPDVEDRYFDEILTGILPSHLIVYEFPDGGIDPYEFLELPK